MLDPIALEISALLGDHGDIAAIFVDLLLVHAKLDSHGLHLFGFLLQVLLVQRDLFFDFWSWRPSEDVFKFDVPVV